MYKVPFREAVLNVYEYTGSLRATSKMCKVSVASISRWSKRLMPSKRKSRVVFSDALVASVRTFMQERTRCSSMEVVQFLKDAWGLTTSRQLAHSIIRRLGFTYKRTRRRGGGAKIREATKMFLETFKKASDEMTLVSVDESGFDQRCKPVYGYSASGTQAIVELIPCKDRKRYNLLMAITQDGAYSTTIRDTTTTGVAFAEFLDQLPYPSGTTILLDGAPIHRTHVVQDVAAKKGYSLLFTPPYSPEFNPIEMVFGSIKNAFYVERYSTSFQHDLLGAVVRCIRARTTESVIINSFQHVLNYVIEQHEKGIRTV